MKFLKLMSVVVFCAQPVLACDLCAVYSALEAHTGKGPFGGVAEQFTRFGTLQDEGNRAPNPTGQYLNSWITQIFAGYNFNDRVGLQLNAPLIYRSFKRPEGFTIEHGSESGIGDLSLLGKFQAYRRLRENSTIIANLVGGIKVPTGNTRRLSEEFNETEVPGAPPNAIHGHDLTLGSGSFDGLAGANVYWRWKRAIFSGGVQYAIRSQGDFDYRFANDLTWSGGPGALLILNDDFTLTLQANVSGETKGRDTFQGAKAEDTGITTVYLGPQLMATWRETLSVEIGADIPVLINNTALQAVPDYRIRAALTWHF